MILISLREMPHRANQPTGFQHCFRQTRYESSKFSFLQKNPADVCHKEAELPGLALSRCPAKALPPDIGTTANTSTTPKKTLQKWLSRPLATPAQRRQHRAGTDGRNLCSHIICAPAISWSEANTCSQQHLYDMI